MFVLLLYYVCCYLCLIMFACSCVNGCIHMVLDESYMILPYGMGGAYSKSEMQYSLLYPPLFQK